MRRGEGRQAFNNRFRRVPCCSGCCGLCPDLPSRLRPTLPPCTSEIALSWRKLPHPRSCPLPRGKVHPRLVGPCRGLTTRPPCLNRGQLCKTTSAPKLMEGLSGDCVEVQPAQSYFLCSPTGADPQTLPNKPPYTSLHQRVSSWEPGF